MEKEKSKSDTVGGLVFVGATGDRYWSWNLLQYHGCWRNGWTWRRFHPVWIS